MNAVLNINLELEWSIQVGYEALVYAYQNLPATIHDENYDDINKTYSIWICMKNHISKKDLIEDITSHLVLLIDTLWKRKII